MTGAQCRAARHLLGRTAGHLAAEALHAAATVRNFEADRHRPRRATMLALREALEAAGVTFMPDGDEVRLRLGAAPSRLAA